MRIIIACVGKLKETYWTQAVQEYQKRISRYAQVEIVEVADQPAPERYSPAQAQAVIVREGALLLSKIQPRDFVVPLCIEGKKHTSAAFSAALQSYLAAANGRLVFVVGGSLGLAPDILARADATLSLSDMTFPHQLARVLLLEQLYRGFCIANNTPYHK